MSNLCFQPQSSLASESSILLGQLSAIFCLKSERYLILNSGTWQSQTPFQAKMGIDPVTGIIPVVNLSTLEVFTKDFKFKEG